ncbi:MAG: hypothetical protein K5695_09045 [Oscillospiraceae bacterium]|nr:hypothetical protein [Oscillospiraceae bacterium]
MIISNEMDGLLLLEGSEDAGQSSTAAGNTSVSVADLDNMTAIADLKGSEGGARLFYDGKGNIYGVRLDAEQNVIEQGGKIDLITLKSGLDQVDENTELSVKMEGNTIVVSRWTDDRETLISGDQLGLNGNITVAEAPASSQTSAADEASQEDGETAPEETDEVTEAEPAETKPETEAAEEEEQGAVLTIGAESAEEETDAAIIATWATVTTEPAVKPSGGNGVMIWAIGATVAAAIAIAGCVLLFKKSADNEKTKKLKDTELKALQRSVDDKTTAFSKGQERIRELETQLAEANEKINALRDEANTSAQVIADERQKLEQLPTEEDLHTARSKAEELQQRYDELYIRARELHRENEQYAARIRELEQGGAAAAGIAKAAAPAAEPAPAETPESSVASSGADAILISTSVAELEKYPDPVFAAPTSSMVSDTKTLNKAPFRRAQLVIIGGKAYLNPHFFRGLGSGMESYANLSGLDSVFETDGLTSNAMKYRLSALTPAEVSYDAASDTYHVDKPGKMVLHIG